jgi:hypothetical protein
MTDIPVQIPAPQQQVPLAEGAAALEPVVTSPPPVAPTSLLVNPIPYQAPAVANVDQAVPADWHPDDPVKRGAAAGHVAIYADRQVGGIPDAAQHWGTFTKLADGGQIPDTGDTAELMRVWRKFRATPESMKPDESAALLNAVSQVGQATAQSPDLKFDPVARVASVGARGEVRVSYPAKTNVAELSLQPLAPSAVDRLRTLAAMGEGTPRPASSQDLVAPYLGIDTNHSTHDVATIDDMVANLAQEMGSTPERVRAQVAAGWDKLKVPAEPWQKPFQVGSSNPAADALNDGLSSNLVDAMKSGVNAIDFTTKGDPAVTVQPEGGLAVSAPPTERNARLLRHLYPAFSQGGVTAWLPGEPSSTEDAAKIAGDRYNDFFLRAQGGHPLFKAGTHIVYEGQGPGEDLGPVLTSGPALKMDRLRTTDIDPNHLDELVQSHQWSLVPGGPAVRASLIRSGFNPILHKIGDSSSYLVFGMTPAQARKHTDGEIVSNDGAHSSDGFRPGDGVSFDRAGDGQQSMTHLAGGQVHWFLNGVDRESDPQPTPEPETTTQRARRRVVEVSGSLEEAVASLERGGAQNVRVYAHRNQLDGFHTAWEHVFTDGTNTTSVLTRNPSSAANAGPVLVRSTEGLPAAPVTPQTSRRGNTGQIINGVHVLSLDDIKSVADVKAAGLRLDGTAIVPVNDGTGDVSLKGGKLVVDTPTPAAGRLLQAARTTGLPESKIKSPAPGPIVPGTPPSKVTISGDSVYPIKQTRPDSSWASKFGIVFDPAWRTSAGIEELDPKLSSHLANVYETFLGQHQSATDLWDLQRIAVTSNYSKTPAYTEWGGLGGSIGLAASHWKDPAALTNRVAELQDRGTIVSNVTPTPAYFLAHELGHVVHGALQFGTDGSGARKQLLTIRRKLGRDGIARGLSLQAWQSPEEMVAEAVAESTLASNPRPLAREITNVISSAYSRVDAAKIRRDW